MQVNNAGEVTAIYWDERTIHRKTRSSILTITEDKRRCGLSRLVALVHLAHREKGVRIQPTELLEMIINEEPTARDKYESDLS
jgi:hypothetical protein